MRHLRVLQALFLLLSWHVPNGVQAKQPIPLVTKPCPVYPYGNGALCGGTPTSGPHGSTSTAEQRWLDSRPARCIKRAESGDPAHPDGDYTRGGDEPEGGAWQFSLATWRWIGFSGYPNQATPATQDRAAFKLFTLVGYSQWETAAGCGA